jgi:alkylhydroperoxidase family enzyme
MENTYMARIRGRPKKGAPPPVHVAYAAEPRAVAKMIGRPVDEPSEPLTLHAWAPAIMAANGAFEIALQRSRRADLSLKELARARTGQLIGCPW